MKNKNKKNSGVLRFIIALNYEKKLFYNELGYLIRTYESYYLFLVQKLQLSG